MPSDPTNHVDAPPVTPEQSAAPRPKAPRKRRGARVPETVWQTLRNRPKRRIESGEAAIAVWKAYGLHGLEKGIRGPRPIGRRSPLVGDPVEVQVAQLVEGTEGFAAWRAGRLDGETFLSRVGEQFPRTFLEPWPGMGEKEIEEMVMDLNREGDEAARGEDRLLPGMRRQEG